MNFLECLFRCSVALKGLTFNITRSNAILLSCTFSSLAFSALMVWLRIVMTYSSFLALISISLSSFSFTFGIELPYEVQETLLDVMTIKNLEEMNITDGHSVRLVYRKDLDSNYIAYYEINDGKNFRVLSAGPKTGDKREVESGPVPTPTQVLIDQAEKVGQECTKFYRLAEGLYMCENRLNITVAATFDWVADSPVRNWRNLQKTVQESLENFKFSWKNIAASLKDEWLTSQTMKTKKDPSIVVYDAELITPGSSVLMALEHDYTTIIVHAVQEKHQKQLCQILVKVCENGKKEVNSELIHKLKNGFSFIEIAVHENKSFVRQVLRNKEISFYVKVETKKGVQILKYFSIDLTSHRQRRWSQWSEWSINQEDLFPDYDQHKCCGCMSGCGPVAWAQVLAYYDRLAQYNPWSGYSKNFWTCKDGYADSCTAPKSMDSDVERYIEGIRSKLGTFCLLGGGATTPKNMKKIINWYSTRGLRGQIFNHYNGLSIFGLPNRSFKKSAVSWLKEGYPVIAGLWTKRMAMHYAVVTRYKERQKTYRKCFLRIVCRTVTKHDSSFYLHMGWGGASNGWYSLNTFAVYCAKKQ